MLTFLLVLTVFSATWILPCPVEIGENVEKGLENNAKNAHSPCDSVQKVVSNNSTTTDQTEIDTGETVVILRETPNESRDSTANNFLTGLTAESMEVGRETTSSTVINITEVTSQPHVVAASQEAGGTMAEPELKTEYKVACCVIPISAAGIISLLAGLPGHEKADLTHKTLFKACTSLTYASFISGLGLFILTKRRRTIPGLVVIVKFTMWVTLGSGTYAISFATCILLHMTLIALIPVLVAPLVFAGLVIFVIYVMK